MDASSSAVAGSAASSRLAMAGASLPSSVSAVAAPSLISPFVTAEEERTASSPGAGARLGDALPHGGARSSWSSTSIDRRGSGCCCSGDEVGSRWGDEGAEGAPQGLSSIEARVRVAVCGPSHESGTLESGRARSARRTFGGGFAPTCRAVNVGLDVDVPVYATSPAPLASQANQQAGAALSWMHCFQVPPLERRQHLARSLSLLDCPVASR